MTCIVYDGKRGVIAWDSRTTVGNIIHDDTQKMIIQGDVRFWIAGTSADDDNLIKAYFEGIEEVEEDDLDSIALICDKGEVYVFLADENKNYKHNITHHKDWAIGSGSESALAVMRVTGCGARAAVNAAKKVDNCTGGKVRTYKIK